MERRASDHVLSLSLSCSGLPLYPSPFATFSLPPSRPGSLHRSLARYRISWPTAKNQFPRFFPPARRIRRQHQRRFHRSADKAKKLRGLPPMTSRPYGVRIVAFHFCKLFARFRRTLAIAASSVDQHRRKTFSFLDFSCPVLCCDSHDADESTNPPFHENKGRKGVRRRARVTSGDAVIKRNSFYTDSGPRSRPSKLSVSFVAGDHKAGYRIYQNACTGRKLPAGGGKGGGERLPGQSRHRHAR